MHFIKIEVFLNQLYLTQSVELQNNNIRQAILNEISNYYRIDIINQDNRRFRTQRITNHFPLRIATEIIHSIFIKKIRMSH